MTPTAVILYGPPASGKNTITDQLVQLDCRYALFERLKLGGGNTDGYRVAASAGITGLRASHDVLFENQRYGNIYLIDRPHLASMLSAGQIPVLHLGQVAGVRAVVQFPARWITVLLWCSRDTSAARAKARGSTDVAARLRAWDETAADLEEATGIDFALRVDTDAVAAEAAAREIDARIAR
jgi:guanylate kinase